MNEIRQKPIVHLALMQLGAAIVLLCALVITTLWEIPQRDFPQNHWWDSTVSVDYWKDIFQPAISLPVFVFVIFLVLSYLGLFLSFQFSNRRKSLWTIGVSISALTNLIILWGGIYWVHGVLGCIENDLKHGGVFGCVYSFLPLEIWHIVLGSLFSILVIVFHKRIIRVR